MLSDLVNRISSERKVKKKFRHPNLSTLKVLQGTSSIIHSGTSLERQIKTSPGRHFRTSPGRQIETSLGWSNRIFRGRPGVVGAGRPRDVLGTNICRLGKNAAYVINLDKHADVDTHQIPLFCNRSEFVYFGSFGVEHVPEEIKEIAGNKNIIANIFRVQANNSVMCGYFCIGLIDFMLACKKLTDITSTFSAHDFEKNDKIVLSDFKDG